MRGASTKRREWRRGCGARVGDLGSGSDYTPFIQHLGVPSTDIGSTGPYGVYHSAFDNYAWFTQNAVPGEFAEEAKRRGVSLQRLLDEQAGTEPPGAHG